MTTHHTPGPISFDEFDNVIDSNGEVISLFGIATGSSGFAREQGKANARRLVTCWNSHDDLVAALEGCNRLITEALPKFNWAASALDANAVGLLNSIPGQVLAALAKAKGEQP